ncbi:MAG: Do family serine endopeptidase [Armatimonadota bacterium]
MKQIFSKRNTSTIIICILCLALGFSLAWNFKTSNTTPAIASPDIANIGDMRNVFIKIAEQASPTVVNITAERKVERRSMELPDIFDWFPFGTPPRDNQPRREFSTSSGTGVIVRSDGYILTNNHVVEGAENVTVKLSDGREFSGEVKRDPKTDLALIKIDAKNLPTAKFADSDNVKVGQWAIAIGNPFGFENTVTVGVVSAITREFFVPDRSGSGEGTFYPDAIQTDASINPGNSGGPLLDIDGNVIGINSAIFSGSGGNVGIGFAVPSNTAKFVMNQLIESGKVVRGFLGILPSNLTPVLAERLGTKSGALVESVTKGTAAEKAGIKVKDVIISIDGKPVRNSLDLRRIVQSTKPGTEIDVVVVRDKKEITLKVTLDDASSDVVETQSDVSDKVGLRVAPLSDDIAASLNIPADVRGVVVMSVEPGSAASRAGIRQRDVIIEIDNEPVRSVAEFTNIINRLKVGHTAIVVIQRGDRSVIVEMRL